MIKEFQGKYRFLSNFWPAIVVLDGIAYTSVEHAYQAAKTLDPALRYEVQKLDKPGDAKRWGRKIKIRPDWEAVKLEIMYQLVKNKFEEPLLSEKLLETEEEELVEGNWWGDTFWGIGNGKGENHLGKILMRVREELK